MQFLPLLLLGAHQNQHEVRTNGEIHRLVGDNHGVKVGLQVLQAFVKHGDEVGADSIHLGVKLAAHHAVTEVDEACAGITLHFTASILERFENDDALWLLDFFRCATANIEDRCGAFLRFVKSLTNAGQKLFDDRGQRAPFFLYLPCEGLDANRIDYLERTEFPGKAPAQGTIDLHNVVGNFRNAPGRVQTHL